MDIPFDHLDPADRIVATTNTNVTLRQLEDPAVIEKIVGVLKGCQADWDVPEGGVPVASVRLNFYQGETLLGNVGVGRRFLTALYRGGFLSRSSDISLYNDLLKLAGLQLGLTRSDE